MNGRNPALRLNSRYTHLVSMPKAVLLVGDDDGLLLESALVRDVVRSVDGRRSAVDIAGVLEGVHSPELVHFAILKMERERLVGGVSHEDCGLAKDASKDLGTPEDKDEATSSLARRMKEAWNSRGPKGVVPITFEAAGQGGRTLLLTDDYLLPDLDQGGATVVANGQPYLLARLGTERVWLGPWISQGNTPCVFCLQERLRINLMSRAYLHLSEAGGTQGETKVERIGTAVPDAAFLVLAHALQGHIVPLGDPGKIRVLALENGASETHIVNRLPQCSACGDPGLGPPGAEVRLLPVPFTSSSGGGYRAKDTTDTLRLLEPLVSPLTGIIRYVRKVSVVGAEQVHVYTASHAHSYGASNLRTLRSDRRDHSGGKGMADLDAKVSALCEAVERSSAVHRGSEKVRVARLSEMEGDAVHPNELLLFSDTQYGERDSWNSRHRSGFQWVPEPYRNDPIEWSPARSLVSGERRWVPSAAVYLGFSGAGKQFCSGDSNGLASGNCLEEAILQGFLELVERDAVALWWYNRARLPGLDLASFPDPRIAETRALYPRLGRDLWALDLTTDLEIPTVVALSRRTTGEAEDIIFGFGAHLDPRVAVLRSLAELNQMLPTVERTLEKRRGQLLPDFWEAIEWWETATMAGHPYLRPNGDSPPRRLEDFPTAEPKDLRDAVEICVTRARSAGCDVLVYDITRPDVGFPVARVMAPGLRHFWRRLGGGRLYDVPSRLGWTKRRLKETEMNPVSMFV